MSSRPKLGPSLAIFLGAFVVAAAATFESAKPAAATNNEQTVFPRNSAELFRITNVWTVHFKFTPEQWEAMEPAGGGGAWGGPGGLGGFRGRGGLALVQAMAPAFMQQGDLNRDGGLSREEFSSLGGKWFAQWDREKRGQLNAEQVRAGIISTFALADMGPPGGGRRGGPGPRGMLGAAGRRNGLSAASGIDFKFVHADLEFAGRSLRDVAVRYKGNSTFMQARNSLKRSFKIDLNKYVRGQKLAGLSKINLHNGIADPSWMNEVMSHRLFREAGVPASHTAYARVFVTVPGQYDNKYFGLYSLVEDLDNNFAEAQFGTRKGAIFKPATRSLFSYLGDDWDLYNQAYDPKTELTEAQKRRVIQFAKFVTQASDKEFAANLASYLDLEAFARFMSVTVWLSNLDSILMLGQNFYMHLHPGTDQFVFMPWDLDHSFGTLPMGGSQEQREQLSIHHPWRGENRFLERVFGVETFKKLYLARMTELSRTLCQPERFIQQVDEIAAAIRPAVREESETKLERFDKVVAGETVESLGLGGRGGFREPTKPIKGFVSVRAQAVADQLTGKSNPGDSDYGFAGFGGRGRRGGLGGPGGPGPAIVLRDAFMAALDANQDGELTLAEYKRGFTRWFTDWNADHSGRVTLEQLRAGINRD